MEWEDLNSTISKEATRSLEVREEEEPAKVMEGMWQTEEELDMEDSNMEDSKESKLSTNQEPLNNLDFSQVTTTTSNRDLSILNNSTINNLTAK
jgi:hypothetical protein